VLSGDSEQAHKHIIQQQYLFLVANVDMDWTTLEEADVVSADEHSHNERLFYARNVVLFQLLFVKSHDEFTKFMNVLASVGQQPVHNYICGRGALLQCFTRHTLAAAMGARTHGQEGRFPPLKML